MSRLHNDAMLQIDLHIAQWLKNKTEFKVNRPLAMFLKDNIFA